MKESITISISISEFKQLMKESIEELDLLPSHLDVSDDEILNQKEAARFLGISQPTIIKWKKDGKIPYEQLPGSSKVRFYKSQLKDVVRQNPHLLQASRS